jgi:hypothetical protein
LCLKVREAKIAKTKYLEEKEKQERSRKSKGEEINEDDVPF